MSPNDILYAPISDDKPEYLLPLSYCFIEIDLGFGPDSTVIVWWVVTQRDEIIGRA